MRKAEIYFTKEKHTSCCQERLPTHSSLRCSVREGGQDVDKIVARDVTLCFFWQLTQEPQAIVNTARGGSLGQVQQTNRLARPDLKAVQIWKCRSKGREGVSGKNWISIVWRGKTSANCWLGHVIGRRKTSSNCVRLLNCRGTCTHTHSLTHTPHKINHRYINPNFK